MNSTEYNVNLAPTKEILSFRAYAVYRRLNHLRRSACQLFQSEPVVRIIHKVEAEVESLRVAVRKDRMLHADLGIWSVSSLIMLTFWDNKQILETFDMWFDNIF